MRQRAGVPGVLGGTDTTAGERPVFALDEALNALRVWTTGCRVLEENVGVPQQLISLTEQHQVRGKQVHDCNIVATMLEHGVQRLATRNASDFKRYAGLVTIVDVGN
jgi:predicted nucleic acid-binding protein